MKFISVWCEYDFNGAFGGNNNEEAYIVDDSLSVDEIEAKVVAELSACTGESAEDLDGLFSWRVINVVKL
ncbi:hypothetical protein VPHF86_0296 [Vibrio phage F86]